VLLRFAVFELDLEKGELRRDGALIRLQPQPFKVLALLAGRAGEVVTREELERELWGDGTFVDFERGLNSCMLLVRGALGDDAQSPRFVRTVPKRGYQFVAPVERVGVVPPEPVFNGRPSRLRTAAAVAASFLALAAIVAAVQATRRNASPPRSVLAVLPFESLGPAGEEGDYFADGLTEELITRLGSRDPAALGVIARTSVMRFKGKRQPVKEVGRELGADLVLEGSVRRAGDRLRVTAQLIRARDETHLWAQTYDRAPGDAIAVQEDVANAVAAALSSLPEGGVWRRRGDRLRQVSGDLSRLPHRQPPSADAHDAYLKGRYLVAKGSVETLRQAITAYESAVALDPAYAEAYASLAEAYHLLRMRASLPPREVYPKAEAAARRAVALDDSLAEAHTALAAVLLWYRWDAAGARTHLERAIALNPSYAPAHHDYAFLVSAEAPEEAVRAIRRASELDPLSPRANVDVGWVYLRTRKFEAALAQCRRTLELEPGYAGAEACVEQSYAALGRPAEALRFARGLLARGVASAEELASLDGIPPEEALRRVRTIRLRRLRERARTSYVSGYSLAVEEAALGEREAALSSLDAAFRERESMLYRIGSDPAFDSLHADARFVALERRVRESAGAATN